MAYEIILGRSESEKKKFGKEGAVFLGRQYVKMGQTASLSNDIYLDVSKTHVVFVCGKRGSGKSYTLGVIAEGISDLPLEISQNISVIIMDTMGIFWTMKFSNKRDEQILQQWGIKAKSLNIVIYTPFGYFEKYKSMGIPTNYPFSIKPSELSSADWALTFGISLNKPIGVLIERIIEELAEIIPNFSIEDIISAINKDKLSSGEIKGAAINRFILAQKWGLFSKDGTRIEELVKGGQVTVIDVSCYAVTQGAEGLKSLAIGLISKKLFLNRMVAKKVEEYNSIKSEMHYLLEPESVEVPSEPLVYLLIDEAHEFLPNDSKTTATDALLSILREGRQPGISLVLASQQPGKIHEDVMTQSDIVISHRLTARIDVDALGTLMQSYMREGLDKQINNLPSAYGAAIVFDDVNERIFPIQVRPRFTWHGGEAPIAIPIKKKIFEF